MTRPTGEEIMEAQHRSTAALMRIAAVMFDPPRGDWLQEGADAYDREQERRLRDRDSGPIPGETAEG